MQVCGRDKHTHPHGEGRTHAGSARPAMVIGPAGRGQPCRGGLPCKLVAVGLTEGLIVQARGRGILTDARAFRGRGGKRLPGGWAWRFRRSEVKRRVEVPNL
jgi:hypothetical protein